MNRKLPYSFEAENTLRALGYTYSINKGKLMFRCSKSEFKIIISLLGE